jgi:hypothetical protein
MQIWWWRWVQRKEKEEYEKFNKIVETHQAIPRESTFTTDVQYPVSAPIHAAPRGLTQRR